MNTANITRNWKTSTMGACTILSVILKVVIAAQTLGWAPALLAAVESPLVIAALATGLGLLFAKDGGVSGAAAAPSPPAREPFDKNLIGN